MLTTTKTRFSALVAGTALLALAAGCDSDRSTQTTPPAAQDASAKVLASAEVANPTHFARPQEPIEFPLTDIGLALDDPRVAALAAVENGEVLPSQLVDINGDGQIDTLLVAIDFAPEQIRDIEIVIDGTLAAQRDNLPKQTQAEISHKVGGEWDGQKYIGGDFQNVDHLVPPEQYTDHSEWIRYEGPGIESDKVGYRVYLDWRNGFDIFGKKTPEMTLQQTGLDGYQSYHEMQDWGMDILKVGLSLGIGGYGFWNGSEVELVSDVDQREVTIVEDGPLYSAFKIDYHGWEINDQKVDMSAHLAMNAGSRLVHTRLTLSEQLPNIAIGMVKHPGTELLQGNLDSTGYAWTYTASWGQQSLSDDDSMLGMAVIYRRSHRTSQVEDDNSYVSVMRTTSETPEIGEVEYYFLAAWDGEHGDAITTKDEFVAYLDEQIDRLTITPRIRLNTEMTREAKAGDRTPEWALQWAEGLASSELERKTWLYHADGWDTNRRRVPKFEYDIIGLQPMAYDELNKVAPRDDFARVPYENTGTFITDDGEIRNYSFNSFNIDYVKPGVVVLRLYQQTGEEKYRKAADILREQLRQHPRTSEGGFWHKQTYPHQIWLDGVYMGMPFMAEYAMMFEEGEEQEATLLEVVKEFELVYEHLRDPETGLYYHAWDEAREMFWADPETGLSPNFWGRGLGWYAMALVDILDFLPEDRDDMREPILRSIRELAPALVDHMDPETATWYQVMDQPNRTGNYREASGSAMFSYFFSKAVRNGYLPESYRDVAVQVYEGLIEEFVLVHPDDTISVVNQCLVGGLGFGRDGSFDYYMTERVVRNDPKGNGPFILAGIETYRLLKEEQ
ncbi:glycoside hydrolase family 88 protein [Marinimicrobium alkaliphilum]|uniref:glycoside hydrolase family 88 protein n=1 Tax=Marinimicrobium alkaliphilum TaxID=2202654 RepID=UPI000DBA47D3|nr:glycoside hydrolase family 88 protein [Marinimicrobium alkaliphilum]